MVPNGEEDNSYLGRLKKYLSEFFTKNRRGFYSFAAIAMVLFLFKRKFYDRLIPSSDALNMITQN